MTLVELLIALALSLSVLVGLSAVYLAVKQSFRFQENTGRLQEDANFALDAISRDLRMAGFAGCTGIQKIVVGGATPSTTYYPGSVLSSNQSAITALNPLATVVSNADTKYGEISQQPFTAFNVLRGFDTVPSAMFTTGAAPTSPTTDSLFFSGGSSESLGVSVAMTAADDAVTIASDSSYGWKNNTYDMTISDCTASSLFKGKVNAAGTSITHDAGLGNANGKFQSDRLFGTDATVMLAQWNFYYVATRTGASTPSLYRVRYDGKTRQDAEEVISNVESMKLHYGESTAVDSLQADTWRTTAADVTDWSRVVAVRVGLMMISGDNNISPDTTLTVPTLLGAAYTVPTGASTNRLRKEFSTTIVLRNSVKAR